MLHPLYFALLIPLACLGMAALGRFPGLRQAWLLLLSAVFLLCVQPECWYLTAALAVLAWLAPRAGRIGAAVWMIAAVAALFWFKGTGRAWSTGLSFVVIQGISCVADGTKSAENRGSLPETLTYLLFFPKLSAGPVCRFPAFRETLRTARVSWDGLERGLLRLAGGLGKKLLIADSLYPLAMAAFGGAAHPLALALSLVCCPLYVYFDFAGCTDVAVGVGEMLGLRLPKNFDRPFRALSLRDFWRRWHMSLSGFFRDYVYIPLGGSRCGKWRRLGNVAAVFLLMGVWHGFTGSYLLFGAWHAALMMLEHGGVLRPEGWKRPLARMYTLAAVSVGFVIFMADGLPVLTVTYEAMRQTVMCLTPMALLALGAGTALLVREGSRPLPMWLRRSSALALLLLAWLQLMAGGYMPMLYAQF